MKRRFVLALLLALALPRWGMGAMVAPRAVPRTAGPALPPVILSPAPTLAPLPTLATIPAPQLAHPLRLIITGPPGAGKGTFSEKIAQDYGVVHVGVGDLLRNYAKTHPDISAIMASGQLVDSQLVLKIVQERLARPDILERGFIFDGFPRRTEEARALEKMLGTAALDGVIVLNVPQKELRRRILARGRSDDRLEVFRERMRIYRQETVPALARFRQASPVLAPKVTGPDIAANYARVKAALARLLARLASHRL